MHCLCRCEQTLNRVGCHDVGVCGKTPEVAALQDLLIYQAKGLGCLSHHARAQGITDPAIDSFINGIIFSTLTNVNFSDEVRRKPVLASPLSPLALHLPPQWYYQYYSSCLLHS